MDNLKAKAEANLNRAYKTLGASPGPGYDIVIRSTNPVSTYWEVRWATKCGEMWLKHMYTWPKGFTMQLFSNEKLANMKRAAVDWGLSYHTDWSHIRKERVDP